MKMTKQKSWCLGILGILAAVVLVAFVRYRTRSDDLVVQFVDKNTGKPMGNLKVTIDERDTIPILHTLDFLPVSMRVITSLRTVTTSDGRFRTRRRAYRDGYHLSIFVVEVDPVRRFELFYENGVTLRNAASDGVFHVNAKFVTESFGLGLREIPVPKQGTLVIPLERAWIDRAWRP